MSNKKKIIDLFQSKGLLFPQTEKEIEEFELINPICSQEPADWNAPDEIIKRGIQKIHKITPTFEKELKDNIQDLKMVARKGNPLPQHIIDKMKANHKKNDK
ncbi:hypothetical protein BAS09_18235 [Elizabethkingia ursingii]|uniref:hypothetical protein n=1 Tax=Elizabethkingia ursingii TaxID=1756150 RepID=UPI00099A5C83|nr:hypothetical protein [Elizabethkingia ursingii]OPC06976.1 hypothetical protein BAS09_18235 [Elizabethkingia ursingii]